MHITLREFKDNYRKGMYLSDDVNTQISAGWYDWFCDDDELQIRLKKIWKILEGVTHPYILDNFRVWFKNNCPAVGPLYDDLRLEPMDSSRRNELYCVISLNDEREDYPYCIYTARKMYGHHRYDGTTYIQKNAFDMEDGYESISDVQDFINAWGERCAKVDAFPAVKVEDPTQLLVLMDLDETLGWCEDWEKELLDLGADSSEPSHLLVAALDNDILQILNHKFAIVRTEDKDGCIWHLDQMTELSKSRIHFRAHAIFIPQDVSYLTDFSDCVSNSVELQ